MKIIDVMRSASPAEREEILRERYQALEDERACLAMTVKDAKGTIARFSEAFAELMALDPSKHRNKLADLEVAWMALEEARAGAKTLIGAARESVRHARKELDEAMRASRELAGTGDEP
jgi:hypothetical protein